MTTIADELTNASEQLPEQLYLIDFDNKPQETETESEYGGELANLLGSSACDDEFTPEQIRVIQDLVIKVFPYSTDHMEMCDYLIGKVHKMNYYQPQSEKRFAYLCKMIESDIGN